MIGSKVIDFRIYTPKGFKTLSKDDLMKMKRHFQREELSEPKPNYRDLEYRNKKRG